METGVNSFIGIEFFLSLLCLGMNGCCVLLVCRYHTVAFVLGGVVHRNLLLGLDEQVFRVHYLFLVHWVMDK